MFGPDNPPSPPLPRTGALAALTACLALLAYAPAAGAELVESYDGPTTTLVAETAGAPVRTLAHERVRDEVQGEPCGAELLTLAGAAGYSTLVVQPIPPAAAVEDLALTVRLRSDRPGAHVAARVVFPATTDPKTGVPVRLVVRGDARYEASPGWASLEWRGAETLVKRRLRMQRAGQDLAIDPTGAYVEALVLVTPVDLRGVSLWVERVEVEGRVAPAKVARDAEAPGQTAGRVRRVTLAAGGFAVEGRPICPSVWRSRGEPLSSIASCGFNTVWFESPPERSLLAEAARLKLWVVCPAPLVELERSGDLQPWDVVLAWTLAGGVDARSIDTATAELERLKRADRKLARPVLAAPVAAWGEWSRLVDGLVVNLPRDAERTAAPRGAAQLEAVRRQARPATPLLAAVAATDSQRCTDQLRAFAPAGAVTAWRDPHGVAAEALDAVLAGAVGLVADASQPLVGGADPARTAADGLTLLNLRLELLRPWLEGGTRLGVAQAAGGPHQAAVLRRDRLTLVAPLGGGPAAEGAVAVFTAPGVDASAFAYAVSLSGVTPMRLGRGAGGASVVLPPGGEHLAVAGDDVRALRQLAQRVDRLTARAAPVAQRIAMARLATAEGALPQNLVGVAGEGTQRQRVEAARRLVSASQASLAARDARAAFASSWGAIRTLDAAGGAAAGASAELLDSSPLALKKGLATDHARLERLLAPLQRSATLLPGGDFEDLNRARLLGWRHVRPGGEGDGVIVELTPDAPHGGARSLRLHVAEPLADTLAPAVSVVSPPIPAAHGQLIEVLGWVRVASAARGAGLEVSDSWGGEQLALSVVTPGGWRPFRVLRRAPSGEPLVLTFSVHGQADVRVDDVVARVVQLPGAETAVRQSAAPR